jgi:hypothetical protein
MLISVLLAIGALPHESIRESSEPVCEAHNRLPHRPGWGASLSVKRHCRCFRSRSCGAGFVGEHESPQVSGEVSFERAGGVAR